MPAEKRRRFLRRGLACGVAGLVAGCQADRDGPSETTVDSTATDTPLDPIDGSWPSYRRDAANTGATAESGPADDPTERWRYTTATGGVAVSPAVIGGLVVTITASGVVVARQLADGTVRWRHQPAVDPETPPVAIPGVTDPDEDTAGDEPRGTIVVVEGETAVGLSAATGETRWERRLHGPPTGFAVDDDRFVVGTLLTVASLDPADGSLEWRRETEGRLAQAPPAVGGGLVAVREPSGTVVTLDAGDGNPEWRVRVEGSLPEDTRVAAPAIADGRVFVASERAITALSDGERRWRRETRHPVVSAPTVTGGGRVFFTTIRADVDPPTDDESDGTTTPPPTDTLFYEATLTARDRGGARLWQSQTTAQYNFTSGTPTRLPVTVAPDDRQVFLTLGSQLRAYDAGGGTLAWEARADPLVPAVTDRFVTTGETTLRRNGNRVWRREPGSRRVTQPAIVANTAYVGSDRSVYALEANTGRVRWSVELGERVRAPPAVADGTVYATTADGTLTAFDAGDGQRRWRRQPGGTLRSPAVSDGTVYVGAFGQRLFAFDASDGSRLWETQVDRQEFVALDVAVGDGAVFGGANGDLRAFETSDGSERWQVVGDRAVQSTPAVADGRCYVNVGPALRAFDTGTGEELWTVRTGGSNEPPAVAGDTVYAPGDDGVYAVDASDGTQLWQTPIGEDPELAVADGVVYGHGFDTPLFALDASDGSRRWEAGRLSPRSPPAVTDGLLFLGGEDGAVYALSDPVE